MDFPIIFLLFVLIDFFCRNCFIQSRKYNLVTLFLLLTLSISAMEQQSLQSSPFTKNQIGDFNELKIPLLSLFILSQALCYKFISSSYEVCTTTPFYR